ncbi:MAG: nucleotide pyrophosphohydrolase [Bacteroidales bacterium]|nr:nucleotide pyrophosphohydrolase [Bacteroidales bacterium]MBN2697753.1 nucleotide pyrophosphohydrolase [Bacteroidales bacterium]
MNTIKEITGALTAFRDERNWKQFHNPKDLALALSIEAAELNELFLWKTGEAEWKEIPRDKIREELADVLAFAFLLAEKYNMDIKEIVLDKIKQNALKYPVSKSYNNATKYNRLQ